MLTVFEVLTKNCMFLYGASAIFKVCFGTEGAILLQLTQQKVGFYTGDQPAPEFPGVPRSSRVWDVKTYTFEPASPRKHGKRAKI